MKYELVKIEYVEAIKISGYKTDIQIQVRVKLKKQSMLKIYKLN